MHLHDIIILLEQKTQHRNLKRRTTRTHEQPVVNIGAHEGYAVPASYNKNVDIKFSAHGAFLE